MSAPSPGIGRLLRTARHLSAAQIISRLHHLGRRWRYAGTPAAPFDAARRVCASCAPVPALPQLSSSLLLPGDDHGRIHARANSYAAGRFAFLGRERVFASGVDWRDLGHTPLWRYQMHYLQPVLDLVLGGRSEAAQDLLASWRSAHGSTWDPEAWHPYPASLRLVNLCHAAAAAGSFDALGVGVAEFVAMHAAYVRAHLETDVRGNHLLENARALLTASRFFTGPAAGEWGAVARDVLAAEIPEQVLSDGAHFELSPMYHCIVLQRLMELAELVKHEDRVVEDLLIRRIDRMATYLSSIRCPDGGIPLLGDASHEFAPEPWALLALAPAFTGGTYTTPESGVHLHTPSGVAILRSRNVFAVFDVGRLCPDYLPAHAQADSLTVEVWVDGACVVADPGLHEYTGPERMWGRSSRAHSTVTLDDRDTSEVYGSFRAGGRARIDAEESAGQVTGRLAPWGDAARITRVVGLDPDPDGLWIRDDVSAAPGRDVVARLHLHEDVRVVSCDGGVARLVTPAGLVVVRSASGRLHTEPSRRSPRFGEIVETTALVAPLAARTESGYRGELRICRTAEAT